MRLGTPSPSSGPIRSRHGAWRDSHTSHATQCGVTTSATLDATFSKAIMDISRATSCGVTQVLVAPRGLTRPKGLLLGILVGVGLD
jgi:invasion protein IalB